MNVVIGRRHREALAEIRKAGRRLTCKELAAQFGYTRARAGQIVLVLGQLGELKDFPIRQSHRHLVNRTPPPLTYQQRTLLSFLRRGTDAAGRHSGLKWITISLGWSPHQSYRALRSLIARGYVIRERRRGHAFRVGNQVRG